MPPRTVPRELHELSAGFVMVPVVNDKKNADLPTLERGELDMSNMRHFRQCGRAMRMASTLVMSILTVGCPGPNTTADAPSAHDVVESIMRRLRAEGISTNLRSKLGQICDGAVGPRAGAGDVWATAEDPPVPTDTSPFGFLDEVVIDQFGAQGAVRFTLRFRWKANPKNPPGSPYSYAYGEYEYRALAVSGHTTISRNNFAEWEAGFISFE